MHLQDAYYRMRTRAWSLKWGWWPPELRSRLRTAYDVRDAYADAASDMRSLLVELLGDDEVEGQCWHALAQQRRAMQAAQAEWHATYTDITAGRSWAVDRVHGAAVIRLAARAMDAARTAVRVHLDDPALQAQLDDALGAISDYLDDDAEGTP